MGDMETYSEDCSMGSWVIPGSICAPVAKTKCLGKV